MAINTRQSSSAAKPSGLMVFFGRRHASSRWRMSPPDGAECQVAHVGERALGRPSEPPHGDGHEVGVADGGIPRLARREEVVPGHSPGLAPGRRELDQRGRALLLDDEHSTARTADLRRATRDRPTCRAAGIRWGLSARSVSGPIARPRRRPTRRVGPRASVRRDRRRRWAIASSWLSPAVCGQPSIWRRSIIVQSPIPPEGPALPTARCDELSPTTATSAMPCCSPMSPESQRSPTTALVPIACALSIRRSTAWCRAASSTAVNCFTSPDFSALNEPVNPWANPIERAMTPSAGQT